MGKAQKLKKKRRQSRDVGKKALATPDSFNNCIVQLRPKDSVINLRGDEYKEQRVSGELFIECKRMAVIPLESYQNLVRAAMVLREIYLRDQAQRQQVEGSVQPEDQPEIDSDESQVEASAAAAV